MYRSLKIKPKYTEIIYFDTRGQNEWLAPCECENDAQNRAEVDRPRSRVSAAFLHDF